MRGLRRPAGFLVFLSVLFPLALCGEETAAPAGPAPKAAETPDTSELLPLKIMGVYARPQNPIVLVERPEAIGDSSFIRSGSGKLETTTPGAILKETDRLLTGDRHQVFGRFGDGTVITLGSATVVEITERRLEAGGRIRTLLSLVQGSLRVRLPPQGGEGTFLVRLPNVKEGPVQIALKDSHAFVYPKSYDPKSKKVTLNLVSFAGTATATYPIAGVGTGDVSTSTAATKTVDVTAGNLIGMSFRWAPLGNPQSGGAVYELFLEIVTEPEKYTDTPALTTPAFVSPPPTVSGGG
jgi:hypothetical protein